MDTLDQVEVYVRKHHGVGEWITLREFKELLNTDRLQALEPDDQASPI